MKESEFLILAKKQTGLLDKSPDSAVPKSYLDELKVHVGLYPTDTNFRVSLDAKQGTGTITCLEGDCGGMVVPANGKPQGLGDVFRLYRRHALGYLPHKTSREGRLKGAQLSGPPDTKQKAEKRSVNRREESSLLKALDTNTPPLSHPNSSIYGYSFKIPLTQPPDKRSSTLTRVKVDQSSVPTISEGTQSAINKSKKEGALRRVKDTTVLTTHPTPIDDPSSDDEPLQQVYAREQIEEIRKRIASARARAATLLGAKAAKSPSDVVKMADLNRQIELNSELLDHFNSLMDPFMTVDPLCSIQYDSSMDTDPLVLPPEYNGDGTPDFKDSFLDRSSFFAATSSSLYGAVELPLQSYTSLISDNQEAFGYGIIDHLPLSCASTSSYVSAFSPQQQSHEPSITSGVIDDVLAQQQIMNMPPFSSGYNIIDGEDPEMRGQNTFMEQGAHTDDISKFLLMAGNAEQFDGNATVDEALEKLGLRSQYDLLPGMAVALMPHQTIGVAWMIDKEANRLKGGALSDEMGLGKTVQMIALMVKNRSSDPSLKTNLIVAPAALLDQWKLEIELKTNRALSCLIYHGQSRTKRKETLLEYDVVLTTYQTMASEWPDYEKEFRKEEERQRKRKKCQANSDASDDGVEYAAKKRKLKKGLIYEVEFYRIILDESQNIRNKRTRMSRAVTELQGTYRWCLTGTPIINSLSDVYPYLRFIRVSPWHDWSEFQQHIGRYEKKRPQTAVSRLQAVIATFLLRRMKDSMLDGKRLIELPEKNISLMRLEFSTEEREIYKMVEIRSQARFNRFLREGSVLKNYHQVLVLLLRLRQVCAHPSLITEDGRAYFLPGERDDNGSEDLNVELARARKLVSPQFVEKMRAKLKEAALTRVNAEKESVDTAVEDDECPICFDLLTDAVVTPCTHVFCRECITDVLNTNTADLPDDMRYKDYERPCPACRSPISKDRLFRRAAFEVVEDDNIASSSKSEVKREEGDDMSGFIVPDEDDDCNMRRPGGQPCKRRNVIVSDDEEELDKEDSGIIFGTKRAATSNKGIELMPRFLPSTKMKYMMEAVEKIFEERPDEKVLVISQWTSCLSLVSDYLTERHIFHVKYQGDMKRNERDNAVRAFMSKDKARVMLMSLKCGGIGLNLTRANNVINLDLAWSQAIESQAFDRVHRLGQTRPVHVQRLVISNTVEDRVLELQLRKQSLADGSLGEGTGKKMKRLSVRELANLFGLDVHGRRNTNY